MFTGLVETTAKVIDIKPLAEGLVQLTVEKPSFFNDLERGHSVAHNGVCLTVKNDNPKKEEPFMYDLGKETLEVTAFKDIRVGDVLNLERPMKMGDRLHGHLVTGHVDEICEVKSTELIDGGCLVLSFQGSTKPEFIWEKGSIVINGVSLTINDVFSGGFSVCLIPETLEKTNLSALKNGDQVNIEYDFWAKGVIHASKVSTSH